MNTSFISLEVEIMHSCYITPSLPVLLFDCLCVFVCKETVKNGDDAFEDMSVKLSNS
jgi:hypothetical protein